MSDVQEDSRYERKKLDQGISFHAVSSCRCEPEKWLLKVCFLKSVTVEIHFLTRSKYISRCSKDSLISFLKKLVFDGVYNKLRLVILFVALYD